jgi:organic hydroperoxide reductase OsmC/OhrA
MPRSHRYEIVVQWTGNTGTGTSGYREYERSHVVRAEGRPDLEGSADPVFRGSRERWNPEQLLVAALSQCHLLSYLHVAADSGVVVTAYEDDAVGTMEEDGRGGGRFSEVVLRPRVTIADASMTEAAQAAHERAHELCFIAASVNFPVRLDPAVVA